MGTDGTPRRLGPIADEVLAWVARCRKEGQTLEGLRELRRIELCALATKEASMFFELYGGKAPSGHLCFGDCDHE